MTLNISYFHLLVQVSILLLTFGVLIPVCGSCSSGLPQTSIKVSSSEQISLVVTEVSWYEKLIND